MLTLPHQCVLEKGINNENLAINELSWGDFKKCIQVFCQQLSLCKEGVVLLKIPNTAEGVALLLASSSVSLTSIIVPSYYNEEYTQSIIDAYHVSHYFKLDNGLLSYQLNYSARGGLNEQPTLCLLSSGTTGIPKCVQHSWESLISRIHIHEKYSSCVWFSGYPVTHFAGMQVVLQCLYNGGHLILPENNHVSTSLKAIENNHPHYLNCTPTFIRQLFLSPYAINWGTSGLKRITLGGEIVDKDVIELIKQHLPNVGITHIYASSELGALIHVHDELPGFPFELIDNQYLMIKDHILWVKPSASAMLAYLNQHALLDAEWVSTNDLVRVEEGRVHFDGRLDEMINIGGYKVNPAVVEQVVRQISGVRDVVVFGKKNPIMGQIVTANILVEKNNKSILTKKEIIQYCKIHLPEYMVPRIIEWVDEIKLTPTYKVLRRE